MSVRSFGTFLGGFGQLSVAFAHVRAHPQDGDLRART